MGNCQYCGKPAGFLRSKHKQCKEKFEFGLSEIKALVKRSFSNETSLNEISERAKKIASADYIPTNILTETIHAGWQSAIDQAFEDGVLSLKEENRLGEMIKAFKFDNDSLNSDPGYIKMVKGAVLREVLEGKIPERAVVEGNMPFNLEKGEKIVWIFRDVNYYEMQVKRQYVGGYQGFSVRIAKGLYYRAGAFKGQPVETNQMVHVDSGILAVTNKHIYFSGSSKGFRVKFAKIVSFQPYSDGLGIQRDVQTAKPQIFVTGDGWFTSNLIMNLAKM
jgi:hypothetical protein